MIELAKAGIRKMISIGGLQKKLPVHLAVSAYFENNNLEELKEILQQRLSASREQFDSLIDFQIRNEIRVLTINLAGWNLEEIQGLKSYFSGLSDSESIHKNQARLFFVGQWYELDFELSEILKSCMEKTKGYDNFFVNFCIRYDGREEVLTATKLLIRKILSGKLKEEDLTSQIVKDNIYTSYFPPPELIVETKGVYSGTLLWDAPGAIIYFTDADWKSFSKKDLDEAIDYFDKINKD